MLKGLSFESEISSANWTQVNKQMYLEIVLNIAAHIVPRGCGRAFLMRFWIAK